MNDVPKKWFLERLKLIEEVSKKCAEENWVIRCCVLVLNKLVIHLASWRILIEKTLLRFYKFRSYSHKILDDHDVWFEIASRVELNWNLMK